jgi:hypothetical protein
VPQFYGLAPARYLDLAPPSRSLVLPPALALVAAVESFYFFEMIVQKLRQTYFDNHPVLFAAAVVLLVVPYIDIDIGPATGMALQSASLAAPLRYSSYFHILPSPKEYDYYYN